jgi:hypothetical protein
LELFVDPDLKRPKLKIAWRLLQKHLGQRMLMDIIPLRPDLVRGTHGRPTATTDQGPLLIGSDRSLARDRLAMIGVREIIQQHFRASGWT